jgi:hypothetical protein
MLKAKETKKCHQKKEKKPQKSKKKKPKKSPKKVFKSPKNQKKVKKKSKKSPKYFLAVNFCLANRQSFCQNLRDKLIRNQFMFSFLSVQAKVFLIQQYNQKNC